MLGAMTFGLAWKGIKGIAHISKKKRDSGNSGEGEDSTDGDEKYTEESDGGESTEGGDE